MAQQLDKIEQGTAYTVQAGDTRESIAMRAYGNIDKWKLIGEDEANKGTLEKFRDRHLTPGTVLNIPAEGGGQGITDHHKTSTHGGGDGMTDH